MPVTTRSQKTSININYKTTPLTMFNIKENIILNVKEIKGKKIELLHEVSKKKPTINREWFIAILNKYVFDIQHVIVARANLINSQRYLNWQSILNDSKYRTYYFDELRLITEMYHIIEQYFPQVYPTLLITEQQKLVNSFYKKAHQFITDLRYNIDIPIPKNITEK